MRALGVLAFLFLLRVLGQLAVVVFEPAFLPPMAAWYSGLIPYPILLPLQAAILVLQGKIGRDLARGRGWFARPRRWAGRPLRRFSCAYFAVMALRYPLTLAFSPAGPWFRGVIPILFHWVLAGYLFILSGWHLRALRRNG